MSKYFKYNFYTDDMDIAFDDSLSVNKYGLNTAYTPTGSEPVGTTYWDSTNHTTSTVLENGVILQNGQEIHIYGKNVSGATITNGTPVSIVQNNGQFTAFSTVDITTPAAYAFVGLATQDIADNAFGYVTKVGVVRGIDTSGFDEGKPVYVSPSGGLTKTYPTVPNYIINVGIVEYKHAQHGRINVISLIVPKIGDLSDMDGTPATENGQTLLWNQTGGYYDLSSSVFIHGLPSENGYIDFLERENNGRAKIGIASDDGYFYINPYSGLVNSVLIGDNTAYTPGSLLSVRGNLAVGETFAGYSAPTGGAIFEGNVGIGKDASSPRGLFDVYKINTISEPASGNLDFSYDSGGTYVADYSPYSYRVYSYKTIGTTRIYSENFIYLTGEDDGSSRYYLVLLNWSAVSGAEGYRVVVEYDNQYGADNDYYFDTPYTNAAISMGFDSITELGYVYEPSVVLTPTSANIDWYFTDIGNISYNGNLVGNWVGLDGTHFTYNAVGIGQTAPPTGGEYRGVFGATGNYDQLISYKSTYDGGDGGSAWMKFENKSGDSVKFGSHHGSGNPWALFWTNHPTVGRVKFYNDNGLASIIYSSKLCLLGDSSTVYGSTLNPTHYLYNTGQSYLGDKVGIKNASATYDLDVTGEARVTTRVRTPEIKTDTSAATDLNIVTGAGKTLVLSTPVYNDYAVNLTDARAPAANAPTWTSYKGSEIPAFSATLQNTLYFSVQLPHSYKEGTDINFHIHLAYPDNTSGNSIWYFTYSWANVGANFPTESNSGNVTIASPTTTDRHQIADIVATISGTGKTISSMLLCSISRLGNNASDTYGNVIYLVGADVHHQIDTMGSRTATAK